ncbi:hypothetical protein G6719_09150 [Polynucleobacter paneuropaeus]|nr:hypothetical protein G6719_09150 [Polynucleobacter paneuropaeus]
MENNFDMPWKTLLYIAFIAIILVIFTLLEFIEGSLKTSKSKEEFYEDLRDFPGFLWRKIYKFIKHLKNLITSLPEELFSLALIFCLFAIGFFFYLVTWDTENLINNSRVDAFTKLLLLNYKTHVQFFLGIVFLVLYGIHTIIKKLNEILKKCNEGDIKN